MQPKMPEKTELLYETLCSMNHPSKSSMFLVGGTAMSIQCTHRLSENLDFWVPHNDLFEIGLDWLISELRNKCDVKLITAHSDIVKAKINGLNLFGSARDYAIDGVKVTFFNRSDFAHKQFEKYLPKGSVEGINIMPLDGIFAMKSYVITQRIKSRDLFDLMHFLSHGKTISELFQATLAASPDTTIEEISSILVGDVPLDKSDEGLSAVCKTGIGDIYDFFSNEVDNYQRSVAMGFK